MGLTTVQRDCAACDTPVRKHNRVKTQPFSLIVITIGPGSTKSRRVEFWLAP